MEVILLCVILYSSDFVLCVHLTAFMLLVSSQEWNPALKTCTSYAKGLLFWLDRWKESRGQPAKLDLPGKMAVK